LASNGLNRLLAVYLTWLHQPWPTAGDWTSTYPFKRNNNEDWTYVIPNNMEVKYIAQIEKHSE